MWAFLELVAISLDALCFREEWRGFRKDLRQRGWRQVAVLIAAIVFVLALLAVGAMILTGSVLPRR